MGAEKKKRQGRAKRGVRIFPKNKTQNKGRKKRFGKGATQRSGEARRMAFAWGTTRTKPKGSIC